MKSSVERLKQSSENSQKEVRMKKAPEKELNKDLLGEL